MKNQSPLICLLLVFYSVSAFCQSDFATVGTQWTYTEFVTGYSPDGMIGLEYPFYMKSDTEMVFNGRLCRRLIGGRAGQPQIPLYYMYNQNDSVFCWDWYNDRFNLLYDFSAETGDSWEIEMPHGSLPEGDTTITVLVDSISYTIINSDTLKVWHITYDDWADWSDILIENVGSTCYMIPSPDIHEFNVCGLRCFENDTLQANFTAFPCDTLLVNGGTGFPEHPVAAQISIYPNPASENLRIEAPGLAGEVFTIDLSDLSGKKISTEHFYNTGNYDMNISDLQNGLYLLLVRCRDQMIKTMKIVVIK